MAPDEDLAAFTARWQVIGCRWPAERGRDGDFRLEDNFPYPSRAAFASAVRAGFADEGAGKPACREEAHRSGRGRRVDRDVSRRDRTEARRRNRRSRLARSRVQSAAPGRWDRRDRRTWV